ncbi:MAG: hemolysin III family protein [Actinomycetota bacterium]|nr:hemolysin III family protein [Actinomycetota bacterium]
MEPQGKPRGPLEDAAERLSDAKDAVAERRDAAIGSMADKRDVALESMADKRDAARETVADAKEAAAEAIARVKPRLRGVSHEYAFFVSLALGAVLVILAKGPDARASVAIYAASLSALFGVSALYHRVDWKRPSSRRWMRRLDHTMIFFLIAGTLTPFAVLVLEPPLATALLVAVWGGALGGTIVELVWTDSPKWIHATVYVAVGLIGAVGFPAIIAETGVVAGILIAAGGVLYVAGAVVYAVGRPDPSPAVFGYHEIFHALVIVAAATHFAAVAFYALPAA